MTNEAPRSGWTLRFGAILLPTLLVAVEASASEEGLVLVPSPPMLGALALLFVILIFPVNALLFRPIFAVLDAREERIAGTRARADQLAAQADETLQRYRAEVEGARAEAELDRRERLVGARDESNQQTGAARSEAEREIEQARQRIHADLTTAREALRPRAEELAREAATQVLGRSLS